MRGIICLTKTLGDVVLGNVLAKNIKIAYPDMELDYVVESPYVDLIKDNPNIHEVIQVSKTLEEWDNILDLVVSGKYDKAFIAQQTSPTDNRWHQTKQYGKSHILNFYAKRCNIKLVDPKLELFVNGDLSADLDFSKPVVALHTKSLVDVKDWSRFPTLVQALKDKGYTVVQLGTKNDMSIEGAIKLELSLREVMLFFKLKKCDFFVGLDSGLSYIAASFETPMVALYGATEVITSGVYGENVRTILAESHQECKNKRGNIKCHGILGGKCLVNDKCIDTITVEQVLEKLKRSENG